MLIISVIVDVGVRMIEKMAPFQGLQESIGGHGPARNLVVVLPGEIQVLGCLHPATF